ncbi:MAG: efflux RND transporter periplasmic adaptor subunit [Bryobacteraceae bacterium]
MIRFNYMPERRQSAAYFMVLTVGMLAFTACTSKTSADTKGGAAKGGGRDAPVPVTIATAVQKDVPVQAQVIGAVEAYSTVTLKAQVGGQLLEANFREGEFVKKGQLLFTIDPRSTEAAVKQTEANILRDTAGLSQSEANLNRDRAQDANAKKQRERAAALFKDGIISKEQIDTFDATANSSEAVLKADLAAIDNSKALIAATRASLDSQKVMLGFTKIYAPITGRTGAILIKPGNIVTANTTELATINQVEPVFVSFSLPENYLGQLRKNAGAKMPVKVVAEEGGDIETGALAFMDNAVDTSTGTIRLKATFTNSDHKLWPGQFVRVTLKLDERRGVVVVPSQAIQSGQEGPFVYVVKDLKVDVRKVVAGQRMDQDTVVDDGLQPGEQVITEGTLRLFPGAKVQVREPRAPSGAGGARGGKKS